MRVLPRRRGGALLTALLALVLLAGCEVPRPPGAEPLRYRDQVFTNVTVTSNIPYGTAPDNNGDPVNLMLDLYRPAGDTQTERPALIWVHGGSFTSGDKTNTVPVDVANTFARLGYVVVSINYRLLAPNTCIPNPGQLACIVAAFEAQHDAQAAVRWLRGNASTYGIDSARVAIGGESAGGITATLVGLRRDDPGSSGNPGPSSAVGSFVSVSGGLPGGAFVDSDDSSGLLFHGSDDHVVSPDWSRGTARAMLGQHLGVSYQEQAGAGHVPWADYRTLYLTQSKYFLYWTLDLAHADGQSSSAARAAERVAPEFLAGGR